MSTNLKTLRWFLVMAVFGSFFSTVLLAGSPPSKILGKHKIGSSSTTIQSNDGTSTNEGPEGSSKENSTASSTESSVSLHEVAQDDTSQDAALVNRVQEALQASGYYQGFPIDGWYGPETARGIREFQRDNDLPITGEVVDKLLALLEKKAGEKGTDTKAGEDGSNTESGSDSPGSGNLPDDIKKYLQPSSSAPSTNPEIVALAKKLKGSNPKETAKNIFNWVRDNIPWVEYMNSQRGALGALHARAGNCCDNSNLMVSLMRASGIPAKYQHCVDCVFPSGTHWGHVWNAIYLDGKWISLDGSYAGNPFGKLPFKTYASIATHQNVPF